MTANVHNAQRARPLGRVTPYAISQFAIPSVVGRAEPELPRYPRNGEWESVSSFVR
jgi:hypothetical protein